MLPGWLRRHRVHPATRVLLLWILTKVLACNSWTHALEAVSRKLLTQKHRSLFGKTWPRRFSLEVPWIHNAVVSYLGCCHLKLFRSLRLWIGDQFNKVQSSCPSSCMPERRNRSDSCQCEGIRLLRSLECRSVSISRNTSALSLRL